MPRQASPTDLSDTQWAILDPLVPPPLSGGRPPAHPRRKLINAMRYVLRGGIAWRSPPHEFPPWQTAYHYFRRRRDAGTWERINTALRERVRVRATPAMPPPDGI